MELGRSAWIRRERLERIATAERDRRAGRTALAIAALGEAAEWPARVVLALALLPDAEGGQARRILEEGLDQWAQESGLPPLDEPVGELDALAAASAALGTLPAPPTTGTTGATESRLETERTAEDDFRIGLERPIEPGELERAFAEAEAQIDEMRDVNDVAAGVLFDGAFDASDVAEDDLDPLERSARERMAGVAARAMDAASVPDRSPDAGRASVEGGTRSGQGPSQAFVLATLERWLQNLERTRSERMR